MRRRGEGERVMRSGANRRALVCGLAILAGLAPLAALAQPTGGATGGLLTGLEKLDRQKVVAAEQCARYDGAFSLRPGAVVEVDLTGDGAPEMVVDFRFFACSTFERLYCATDACPLQVHEGAVTTTWRALDWQVLDWGPDRVLLILREGDVCGASPEESCYEAVVWRNGRFLTAGPIPD